MYTDDQKRKKNEQRRRTRAARIEKFSNWDEIESKMRDKIERLRGEIRRQEEEHQIVVDHAADLEHRLHLANKKIDQLEATKNQLLNSCHALAQSRFEEEVDSSQEGEESKQVVENVCKLLEALPQMSPYCLSLLHFLNKKLPCQCALQLFSISALTYTQAKNLQQPPLLDVKYKPHV